ncbi:MAG: hypothetical protein P8P72_04825 [Flavobacteriaceae bacterium]|nr:hypothetical protein [Flavobacteriaceae bacterium]
MKHSFIGITLVLGILLSISCESNPRPKRKNVYQSHKNIDSLVSYMNRIPESKDTVFAGFRLGMTKKEFRDHIKKLRSQGKKVTYEKDLGARSIILNTRIDLGDRYVYYTPIFLENYGDEYTGNAKCVLLPNYSKNGKMASLKIVSFEEWEGRSPLTKKWMQSNLRAKYNANTNPSFKHRIIGKVCEDILDKDLSELYYTSETLMITNPAYVGNVEYWSTKAFVAKAIIELKKQELKKEESDKTTF